MTPASAATLLLLCSAVLSCGGRTSASSLPDHVDVRSTEPRWEDAFQRTTELVLLIRPQALRRDRIYGPLLGRGIELARQHSRLAVATGALDAMLDAEEVVVGVDEGGRRTPTWVQDATDDLVVAILGVRAEIDPATIVDEGGKALWAPGPNAPAADVRELLRVHDEGEVDASLFELPARNWVIATGAARVRARDSFSRAARRTGAPAEAVFGVFGRPERNALAVIRVNGAALVARVGSLRPPGMLAPIGHRLTALTLALSSGDDGVIRATLEYAGAEVLGLAETTVRDAIDALVRAKSGDYAWLQLATVTRMDCCIVVTTPVPARLLGKLPERLSSAPSP